MKYLALALLAAILLAGIASAQTFDPCINDKTELPCPVIEEP